MRVLFSLFSVAASALLVASSTANAQISLTKVAQIPTPAPFSAARISGNYLYSAGNGFQVFDISNRTNPVNIATVGNGGQGLSISGNYAYVTPYPYGPLLIYDISTPANPILVGGLNSSSSCVSVFGRYAFVDAGIYDISNPTNPVPVGQLPGVGPNPFSTHNFVSASGNYAYVAQNSGELIGLIVFNITDPTQPVRVGQAASGQDALDVALSGHYAYIAAPTNCGFAAFDISNPTNPVPVNCLWSLLHSSVISGNYAYLDWNYLRVVDISNPTNLTQAAVVNDCGPYCVAVTGNYVYASECSVLSVYRLDVPPPPLSIAASPTNTLVLTWPAPTIAFAVQQTHDLNGSSWVTLTNAPSVVASKNQVVIPTPGESTFYRLAVSSQ